MTHKNEHSSTCKACHFIVIESWMEFLFIHSFLTCLEHIKCIYKVLFSTQTFSCKLSTTKIWLTASEPLLCNHVLLCYPSVKILWQMFQHRLRRRLGHNYHSKPEVNFLARLSKIIKTNYWKTGLDQLWFAGQDIYTLATFVFSAANKKLFYTWQMTKRH